ncbi:MAG: pyridoxamine kinase [Ruminococcaceae bacterium]|nr:pyridoxamine kinase [Oscillospiraceae bacterium]
MINKNQHRVAAIHDLSGFGRCSLAVIIPVLSSMGIQCCPVPTAVLSTHTGGFEDIVIKDLTDYISPALSQYKKLGIEFDAVYSGFLASAEQIDHCLEFFSAYKDGLKIVDPVMGDHGKPYRTYTSELCKRMGELVDVADVITPNLTEAAILLGELYPVELTAGLVKSWLARLCERVRIAVITGVPLTEGVIANVGCDKEHGGFWRVDCDYVPASYPGTGDIFASVLTGSLLLGDSLPIAMDRATAFTQIAIKNTYSYGMEPRNGVLFEPSLSRLNDNAPCSFKRL